jgi:ABC-2 type transport system ATP-binding protein
MSSQPIIETVGLRRTFKGHGKAATVEAVAGVDLRVAAGQIFGFLGPNGAGKTTTLRILATLLPPTAGSARIAGLDVARQASQVREKIGYVAQSGGSYRESTGREELVIQGRLFGMKKAEAAERAQEILEA